ncbi:MAG: hypothetical protein JST00_16155 [Deltaproteobacteria bacterium]|nr:hypothetical protein [Deltaproteobacteria bacterium]
MTQRARVALATMLLAVLVIIAYARVERGVFVWDDHALVDANRAAAKEPLHQAFTRPFWANDPSADARPPYYRPIVTLSYRADLALDSEDEASPHVTNLILHILALTLMIGVGWRLTANVSASVLAGGAWALAPRLTESVAWVSGRTDVLAAIFVFAALLLWPWMPAPSEKASPKATRRAIVASIALLFALLSKETAVGGAIALATATWIVTRKERAGGAAFARRMAPIAGAVVAYAVLRSHAMASLQARPTLPLGPMGRALTFLEAVGRYVAMTADPFRPATSIGFVGAPSTAHVVVGGIALLLGAALAFRAARRDPPSATLVGVALTVGTLLPVVHLLPIGLSSAVVADRLMYLPLAGLALAAAVAGSRLRGRPAAAAAVAAGALAMAFVPVVAARAAIYTDELTFRLAAIDDAHPDNTAPITGLATVLRSYREHDAACRLHALVRARLEARGRTDTPRYVRSVENVGQCLALFGDYEGASVVYESLAAKNPRNGRIRLEIGYLALHRLDFPKAAADLAAAIDLDPSVAAARTTIAELPKLEHELVRFASPEARAAEPRQWAGVLSRLGRRPEAIAAWVAVVESATRSFGDVTAALVFLLDEADFTTAERGIAAWRRRATPEEENALGPFVRHRLRQHARFVAVQPRIEALLARGP